MSTMISSPLPTRHAVRSLLTDLVEREVDLHDAPPLRAKASNVVAVYVTDKLAVSAIVVLDIAAAAHLGGALGLLPRTGVEDAVAEKTLHPALRENCHEVFNVLTSLFNVPGAPHVRLYEMLGPDGNVPADVAALSAAIGHRMDVAIDVAGYGSGSLSVVCR